MAVKRYQMSYVCERFINIVMKNELLCYPLLLYQVFEVSAVKLNINKTIEILLTKHKKQNITEIDSLIRNSLIILDDSFKRSQ